MCDKCKHGIWCPTWAEWKCVKTSMRIYSIKTNCADYEPRPKDEDEPKCQCHECLERGDIE